MVQKRSLSGNTWALNAGPDRSRLVAGLSEAGGCRGRVTDPGYNDLCNRALNHAPRNRKLLQQTLFYHLRGMSTRDGSMGCANRFWRAIRKVPRRDRSLRWTYQPTRQRGECRRRQNPRWRVGSVSVATQIARIRCDPDRCTVGKIRATGREPGSREIAKAKRTG